MRPTIGVKRPLSSSASAPGSVPLVESVEDIGVGTNGSAPSLSPFAPPVGSAFPALSERNIAELASDPPRIAPALRPRNGHPRGVAAAAASSSSSFSGAGGVASSMASEDFWSSDPTASPPRGIARPPEESVGIAGRYSKRAPPAFVAHIDGERGPESVVHGDDWYGNFRQCEDLPLDPAAYAECERRWNALGPSRVMREGAVYTDERRASSRDQIMELDDVRDRILEEEEDAKNEAERYATISEWLSELDSKMKKYDGGDVSLAGLFARPVVVMSTGDTGEPPSGDNKNAGPSSSGGSGGAPAVDDGVVHPFATSVRLLIDQHSRNEREESVSTVVRFEDSIEDQMDRIRSDRLAPVRAIFRCAQEILAANNIAFEPMQRDFFREFVIASGPAIFGRKRWEAVKPDFMIEFGMTRHSPRTLALTPRRCGKTWIVTIFCLAFMMTIPKRKIVIIGQNKRTSVALLKLMKGFLSPITAWTDRIALDSVDHLAVLPKGLGPKMTKDQKKNHSELSTVWALPSTADGTSACLCSSSLYRPQASVPIFFQVTRSLTQGKLPCL